MNLPHHYEYSAFLPMPPRAVFDYLDGGRRLGSEVRLAGRIFGAEWSVAERVIERNPPRFKVWQTIDSPRLLIIGDYRMGFQVGVEPGGSMLTVFINYALPQSRPGRWLSQLLGGFYARWCSQQMVEGAKQHFTEPTPLPEGIRTLQ